MIKLKHTGKGLNEQKATMSNLTVITEDGEFYSMVLYYDRFVKLFNYYVKDSKDFVPYYKDKIMKKQNESDNYSLLCDRIQGFDSNIMLRNSRNQDLKIKITGVYYIDNKIGVRIEIINRSSIDFDIDQILFRNKLKKKIISPDYLYQERVVMPV